MKWVIFVMLLNVMQTANATEESVQVQKSLKALIDPILRKNEASGSDFTLRNCEKHKIDWGGVLLMKGPPSLNYRFAPGCDIEGIINPLLMKEFPIDLKLKNLASFERLISENKITPTLEQRPVLNLEVRNAKLIGKKGEVKFEADYAIKIDFTKTGQVSYEDLGGNIRIKEVYGKPVALKEKFKLK